MAAPTRASGLTAGVVAALTDGSGNATFTLNVNPATANDSLMVSVFGARSGTVTVSGGGGTWTQVSSYNDTGDLALTSIWQKRATATDVSGATYTITTSQASTRILYAAEVVTGGLYDVTSGATMKFTSPSAASGTAVPLAAASLAPTTANDLFYGFIASAYATTSAVTFSVPTNYTLAESIADASTDGSLYLWYRAKSSDSTAENPSSTLTYTGALNSGLLSALVAFKPTPIGPITSSPASVSFSTASTTISVSDPNNLGTVNVVSNNTAVVTVSPASFTGAGPQVVTITGVATGTTTLTLSDGSGNSTTVNVTYTAGIGPITVSGTGTFTGNATTLTVSDPGNTGALSATVNDTTIATISPSSGSGAGPIAFTVSGIATGTTYVTFADTFGNSKVETISYTVGAGGSIGGAGSPSAVANVPPPPRILLQTQPPPQAPPQGVEIALSYGGDFVIAPNGDLQLVYDTFDSSQATQQRLERMLMTSPTLRDVDQVAIGRADDLFNPDYGAGLPAIVGEPNTPTLVNAVRSRILAALAADAEISQSPPPVVNVVQVDAVTVEFDIVCRTVAGQAVAIPPKQLQITGG